MRCGVLHLFVFVKVVRMTEKVGGITMNKEERAEHLKTLIRHSTETELKMTSAWFDDTLCSERMSETKKDIKKAIEYLEKDGTVDINIGEGDEWFIVRMKAI